MARGQVTPGHAQGYRSDPFGGGCPDSLYKQGRLSLLIFA